MNWLYIAPLWVSGPLLLVVLVGLAVLGLLAVRKWVLPRIHVTHSDSHFVGPIVHSVMVFYGLMLGLIAVNVFETYGQAKHIVTAEAAAIAALYRDTSGYPEPTRSDLRAALTDYVEYTIYTVWPAHRAGKVPAGGVDRMDRFEAYLANFEPTTEAEKVLHGETWRAFNDFIVARRTRLDRVQEALPGVMWFVVLLGAGVSLCASFFFHVPDVKLHVILVSLLATFIASVIFVTLAMDHPFRGDLGITPESYELIYHQVMKH